MTPRMTRHARERCAEMGVSTKVAKQIIRHADITHETSARGRDRARFVATSRRYPRYAVAYFKADDGVPVVCTLLFATDTHYERKGATWAPKP